MTFFKMPSTNAVAFQCDGCGTSLDTEKRDFAAARNVKAAQGWKSKLKDNGQWQHFCSKCKD